MAELWQEERLLIDGKLVRATGGRTYPNIDPATADLVLIDAVDRSTQLLRISQFGHNLRDRGRSFARLLLKHPQHFSSHVNRQIIRYLGRTDDAWRKYLFY